MHWYLDVIEEVGEKINVAEQQIQKLFEKDEICGFIESLPGIGELLAVLIRAEGVLLPNRKARRKEASQSCGCKKAFTGYIQTVERETSLF